jgi:hypothetical protein
VDASLLATAAHKTEAAGGAEIAMQIRFDVPGTDEPMPMTGSGVVDAAGQRGRMTMNMPGVGEIEMVTNRLTAYVQSDLFGTAFGGKEWMKIDMKRATEGLGIDMDPLQQMGQGPSDQLRMLEQVSDEVTEEGRETVVGVETTHYRATIDPRKYPGEDLDKLIELMGQSEFPMDVWIDDEQRVRRMEWEQSFDQSGIEAHGELVMEYVRFGVPVDIDIPDEDDVFDMTEITGQTLDQLN